MLLDLYQNVHYYQGGITIKDFPEAFLVRVILRYAYVKDRHFSLSLSRMQQKKSEQHLCAHSCNMSKHVLVFPYLVIALKSETFGGDEGNRSCSGGSNVYTQLFITSAFIGSHMVARKIKGASVLDFISQAIQI